jgi:hypothetical protein
MKIYVFWLILITADVSFAQQVIVNADGTHSIAMARIRPFILPVVALA